MEYHILQFSSQCSSVKGQIISLKCQHWIPPLQDQGCFTQADITQLDLDQHSLHASGDNIMSWAELIKIKNKLKLWHLLFYNFVKSLNKIEMCRIPP